MLPKKLEGVSIMTFTLPSIFNWLFYFYNNFWCQNVFFFLFQSDQQHSKNLVLKILLAMAVFVSVLALVYSIIFHWSPWSALYFVTMTTFANGNIGDLVPEVIFHLSSILMSVRLWNFKDGGS